MRRTAIVAMVACAAAALSSCTGADPAPRSEEPPTPTAIPPVQGLPGKPVTLTHEATAGEVFTVFVQPLPMSSCEQQLTVTDPEGTEERAATLDPTGLLPIAGTWSWTYQPCPGDTEAYVLRARSTRVVDLELDGDAVQLDEKKDWMNAVRFTPPTDGTVVLEGGFAALIGPGGGRSMGAGRDAVFNDGILSAPVHPETTGEWIAIGLGQPVRLVSR